MRAVLRLTTEVFIAVIVVAGFVYYSLHTDAKQRPSHNIVAVVAFTGLVFGYLLVTIRRFWPIKSTWVFLSFALFVHLLACIPLALYPQEIPFLLFGLAGTVEFALLLRGVQYLKQTSSKE